MIEAVIFDMDGVLIDSEPIWRDVEIEVFARYGVQLTEQECKATIGLRTDDVVRYRLPDLPPTDLAAVETLLLDRMVEMIGREGQALRGALAAVDFVKQRGVRLALASSSPDRLIAAVLARLGVRDRFEAIHSAEHEEYGKPHPAVYITTAKRLGVGPERCLAIEDSLRGVIAAKAASMRCIAVPEAPDPRFAIADLVLRSLTELDENAWLRAIQG